MDTQIGTAEEEYAPIMFIRNLSRNRIENHNRSYVEDKPSVLNTPSFQDLEMLGSERGNRQAGLDRTLRIG